MALAAAPAGLPTAELRMDQYTLRNVNDELNRNTSGWPTRGCRRLKTESVVTKEVFDKAANASTSRASTASRSRPRRSPPPGRSRTTPLTLLPALHYTLPLLLLALSLWGAWRVVNFPPFADFLIATEAELNKVSWTTRPRLIQDTIVVLVTVFLMAMFLFLDGPDVAPRAESWKPIGVLQIPDESTDKNKSAENLKW